MNFCFLMLEDIMLGICAILLLVAIYEFICMWLPSVVNPYVSDNLRRRWHVFLCRQTGCIHSGPYYGMPQAHCRRCGKKTWSAEVNAEEWIVPWGEYEVKDPVVTNPTEV